jgi:hypothetical protein
VDEARTAATDPLRPVRGHHSGPAAADAIAAARQAEVMIRIVGIDPGLSGGLGVLDVGNGGELVHAALERTPTVHVRYGRQRKQRHVYNVPAMRKSLLAVTWESEFPLHATTVVLELQHAMPTDARRAAFATGFGFGLWLGLIVSAGLSYQMVPAAAWKRHHGLLHADKRASRLRCGERFPALAPIQAADEGPAEALLLAAYVAAKEGHHD